MKLICTILLLCFCTVSAQDISGYKNIVKDTVYIDFANLTYGRIEFTVTKGENYRQDIRIKEKFILKPVDSAVIAAVPIKYIKDTTQVNWQRFFGLEGSLGDPETAKHDDTYLYSLPFAKGKKYKIIQGFNGKFSHNTERSRYAIDFNLQVGDTVYAAREGTVVKIRDKFKEYGGRKYISKANKITVVHKDGTFAAYVHLKYKGVFVQPGDSIKRGQPIGICGLTGFTTTPHLHFVVREARNKAIPIYFEGYKNKILKQGKKYARKK